MIRKTRQIHVGSVPVGGGAPVTIQSMCNTPTQDVEATVAQIHRLEAAGCEIVRVAVPDMEAAKAIGAIKKQISIPLVVDIHFDYKLALASIDQGCDAVRINPGNIGSIENVRAVAMACQARRIPIRVGVNSGSVDPNLIAHHGGLTPEAMMACAFQNIRPLEEHGFRDICVSLKSSSVSLTMKSYELMAQTFPYPLHLGITEAGTPRMGILKSAAGIGGLLAQGIGDTIRVSLAAAPEEEVYAARDILRAVGIRRDAPQLIACPTCGRTRIDLLALASEVEERLKTVKKPITVAVMGCAVNGPGEARAADVGIAGGDGEGLLFQRGEIVKKLPQDQLVDTLFELIEEL